MNIDGLVQSVVRFTADKPVVPDEPINPDYYGTQTGDPLPWILFGVLAALIIGCGIAMYVYRKRALAKAVTGAHTKQASPFTDTRFMFVAAIVLLVVVSFGVVCFNYANKAFADLQTTEGVNAKAPAEIVADVTDDGIVFQKQFGENVSFITNDNNNDAQVCFVNIDSNVLDKDEEVNWTVTIGEGEYETTYNLLAGESMMSKFTLYKYHSLPVNISTDMSVERAKELIDQNVITITFGVIDPVAANSTQIENLCNACQTAINKGVQTKEDLIEIYDDEFIYNMLAAVYNGWYEATNAGLGFYTIAELMSPECFPGGSKDANDPTTQKLNAIASFNTGGTAPDNMLEEEWNAYFEAIARPYIFQQFISNFTGLDESVIKQYSAETDTLKAYCYYDLVRLFGNVPIVEYKQEVGMGQASEQEVYKYIADLCDKSVPNLTDKGWLGDKIYGKMTKTSANYLHALCCLDQKDFNMAKSILKPIVEDSKYALVPGERYTESYPMAQLGFEEVSSHIFTVASYDNFDSLYNNIGVCDDHNEEIIVSQNFNDSTSDVQLGIRPKESRKVKQWQANLGLPNFTYGSFPTGIGSLCANSKYFQRMVVGDGYGDIPWGAFEDNKEQDAYRTYSKSILYIKGNGPRDQQNLNLEQDLFKTLWNNYTGYVPFKYMPISLNNATGVPVYYPKFIPVKLSDAYLNYAECCINTGDNAEAKNYINRLQFRAGAGDTSREVSAGALINYYLKDQMFEAKDFWNLKRLRGIGPAAGIIADAYNDTDREVKFEVNPDQIIATNGYLQIPQSVMAVYGYKQNPGW